MREDILEALELVLADSGLSLSKVVEVLLTFGSELNTIVENALKGKS